MAKLKQADVVAGTAREVRWWLNNRLKKFQELDHESMAINPFMAPVLMGLHAHAEFTDLAELLLGGHFMVGHATGFGKLIDEKILPKLFGSTKINKSFRKIPPFNLPVFSEVDHVIGHGGQTATYLSLKASRWTIQLTMAEQMNSAFAKLVALRASGTVKFEKIVVGVIYGTQESLTDKFSIIRGICSGAEHDVTDIQDHVEVVAGRKFWAWVNEGEDETQDWVLEGVLDAVKSSGTELAKAKGYLDAYKCKFSDNFKNYVGADKTIDWAGILHQING